MVSSVGIFFQSETLTQIHISKVFNKASSKTSGFRDFFILLWYWKNLVKNCEKVLRQIHSRMYYHKNTFCNSVTQTHFRKSLKIKQSIFLKSPFPGLAACSITTTLSLFHRGLQDFLPWNFPSARHNHVRIFWSFFNLSGSLEGSFYQNHMMVNILKFTMNLVSLSET